MNGPTLFFAEHTLAVLVGLAVVGLSLAVGSILLRRRFLRGSGVRARIVMWLGVAIGAGMMALSGVILAQLGKPLLAQESMIGQVPPELEYVDLRSGRIDRLDRLKGKVLVVNFWATWCPPCREEMPDLQRLQENLGEQGLQVLHISDEEEEKLEKWMELHPMSTLHGRVSMLPWPEWGRPTTYIVDRQGVLRQIIQGPRSYDQIRKIVAPWM